MSKSRGNVINPDDIIDAYGADTFRLYEMFIGPFDQVAMWSDESLMGVYRFVGKVFNLFKRFIRTLSPVSRICGQCTNAFWKLPSVWTR